jgi:hypothetical protein
VTLVEDAYRRQHHARAHIEIRLDEEVQISLLESDFSAPFAAFGKRVLELELAPELDPVREAVAEKQYEAMEVRLERLSSVLIEMEIHIACDREARLTFARRFVISGDRNLRNGRRGLPGRLRCRGRLRWLSSGSDR